MQKMGLETREPCSEQWILHDPAESCPAAVGMLWYAYKIGPQLCALSCVIILPASKLCPAGDKGALKHTSVTPYHSRL